MSNKTTWRELKAIANEVPEELLDQPVVGWPEDDDTEGGIEITGFEILDEDHLFDGDEGAAPASIVKENTAPEDFNETDFPLIHPKGSRILTYK